MYFPNLTLAFFLGAALANDEGATIMTTMTKIESVSIYLSPLTTYPHSVTRLIYVPDTLTRPAAPPRITTQSISVGKGPAALTTMGLPLTRSETPQYELAASNHLVLLTPPLATQEPPTHKSTPGVHAAISEDDNLTALTNSSKKADQQGWTRTRPEENGGIWAMGEYEKRKPNSGSRKDGRDKKGATKDGRRRNFSGTILQNHLSAPWRGFGGSWFSSLSQNHRRSFESLILSTTTVSPRSMVAIRDLGHQPFLINPGGGYHSSAAIPRYNLPAPYRWARRWWAENLPRIPDITHCVYPGQTCSKSTSKIVEHPKLNGTQNVKQSTMEVPDIAACVYPGQMCSRSTNIVANQPELEDSRKFEELNQRLPGVTHGIYPDQSCTKNIMEITASLEEEKPSPP